MSKKKKILVCICIPTYNSEKTIKNTVLSILDQSYKNIIVKIVDNASNDKTLNLISSKLAFIFYRLIGSQKTMRIPPYHLTEFNSKTATKMFEKCGFSKTIIKEEIKAPNTITLRGNWLENTVKLSFQYLNYYLTKWFGISGDRMHIETYK